MSLLEKHFLGQSDEKFPERAVASETLAFNYFQASVCLCADANPTCCIYLEENCLVSGGLKMESHVRELQSIITETTLLRAALIQFETWATSLYFLSLWAENGLGVLAAPGPLQKRAFPFVCKAISVRYWWML